MSAKVGSILWFVVGLLRASDVGSVENPPIRLALSEQVVRGVSLNDARAALTVWAEEIGKAANINVAPGQNMVLPSDQLLAAIRRGSIDLFCVTLQEYRQVIPYVETRRIIMDEHGGEEMVLLVREGIGVTSLGGLRGRSLIIFDAPIDILASPWLAVSLWKEGLDSPDQFFGHITHNTKLAQVVLPVFFGQADVCLVTRRGLDTMFELNPQLQRKLRILRMSSRTTCAFFACRKGSAAGEAILPRLVEIRSSLAAKQVLTLFQSPGFALGDLSYLRSANDILDAYERHHESATTKKK